jgi:hypothetical protein
MLSKLLLSLSFAASTLLYAGSLSSKPIESSLVVYNGNIGLVHEDKTITLDKGAQEIVYKDVAQSVVTDSVNVKFPAGVTLYSQQYRFDKITAAKLLNAHIGKKIKVKTFGDNEKIIIQNATLLSSAGSQCIVRTDSKEIFSVNPSMIIMEHIPDELITQPSLVWNVDSGKKTDGKISLDYLINNIKWKSNYILDLDGSRGNLGGWITVDNRSGKRFDNVKLNVLAGDVNRARMPVPRVMYKAQAVMSVAPEVSHIAAEGYHFYSVPFRVTLANNEKTQIKFIDEKSIPIKRRYKAWLNNPNYLSSHSRHDVKQYAEIESLEIPLPGGIVRTYSKVGGTTLLLGESRLEHTPRHEKISLVLGTNFDIKVNEKVVERNDDKYYFDETIAYEAVNRSSEERVVELFIPFTRGRNSSLTTDQDYSYKDGNTLLFKISLKADSKKEFKVHYRSRK